MYTSDEIQTAVEKLVRSSIRKPIGTLGNRELSVTLSDVQDAAAGVFISYHNAPYYVLYLGAQRLLSSVRAAIDITEDLLDAVTATGRRALPIESVTSLYNASTALGELAKALKGRRTSFTTVEDVPAYTRFERNTGAFLDLTGNNIRKGGDIVRTAEEGRLAIPSLLSSLKELHANIKASVTHLEGGLEDFTGLGIASSLSESILANAQEVMQGTADNMEALSPSDRLELLRDSTLNVLTSRAVVKGFGALTLPTVFVPIEGDSSVYADSSHLATPATVAADVYGPYPLLGTSNQLDIFLESDPNITTTIQMPGSYVAFIPGALAEDYNIVLGDEQIVVSFTDAPTVIIPLTVGAAVSAYTIANDLNTGFTAIWGVNPYVEAEVYYYPTRWTGELDIVSDEYGVGIDGLTADASVDFAALGVDIATDRVVVRNGVNKWFIYSILAVAGNVLQVQLVHGGPTVDSVDTRAEVGSYPGRIRMFIPEAHYTDALAYNWAISLPKDGFVGDTTAALNSIGFFPESVATTRPITALEIEEEVNRSPSVAVGQTTRLVVGTEFVPALYEGKGRTDLTTSLRYILYKIRGYADVSTVGPLTTLTLAGAAAAGVVVGDIVVLREAGDPADVNLFAAITAIAPDDSYVEAIFSSPPTDVSNVLVEVGPSTPPTNNCILLLSEGSVADGEYRVARSGAVDPAVIPFELPLLGAIPSVASGGLPILAEKAQLGYRRLTFTTEDRTLASRIQITDGDPFYYDGVTPIANPSTAFSLLFTGPVDAVGTTPYVTVPKGDKRIELGDTYERYITNPRTPDSTHTIVGLELSSKRISVSPELDCNLATVVLSQDDPIPFARIRKAHSDTYSGFQEDLDTWLDMTANDPLYFQRLYGYLNPLLRNSNPTSVQLGDAQTYLGHMYTALDSLQQILSAYEATSVPAIDSLVGSLTERGADRAVDILLSGRFSTFFGLNVDTVSYAGTVLRGMREVNREDLAVRKVRRKDMDGQTLISSWEDQDFEFDTSDIDDVGPADVPFEAPPL